MDTPDTTPSWDERIRWQLSQGEETALGELYDRYAPLVHGIAGWVLEDQQAADQLTREVFAQVWQHPEEFDPARGSLRTWLGSLTHGLARARVQYATGTLPNAVPETIAIGWFDGLACSLRQQMLDWCLARRPADRPVPPWAAPYAAESAKLDALLRDLGSEEWQVVAELPWHGGVERWRPAEVLCHLAAVDGYLAPALGLPDPVPGDQPPLVPAQGPAVRVPPQGRPAGVLERTQELIAGQEGRTPAEVHELWRRQSHALIHAASLGAGPEAPVDFGFASLPLADAFLDRAFECWIHGDDLARAVDYPYTPPAPQHLRRLIDLGARMLPYALAALRQLQPQAVGAPGSGRLLKLVIDGPTAGSWLIPLDGQSESGEQVAEMVLDGLEFCYLAAAHRDPALLPVGTNGDREAISEVLHAVPLLSRP